MISHDTDRPRALTYVRGYSLFYENEHPPSTNKNPPGFSPHYVQYAACCTVFMYVCMYVYVYLCNVCTVCIMILPYNTTVYVQRTAYSVQYSVQYSDMDRDTVSYMSGFLLSTVPGMYVLYVVL